MKIEKEINNQAESTIFECIKSTINEQNKQNDEEKISQKNLSIFSFKNRKRKKSSSPKSKKDIPKFIERRKSQQIKVEKINIESDNIISLDEAEEFSFKIKEPKGMWIEEIKEEKISKEKNINKGDKREKIQLTPYFQLNEFINKYSYIKIINLISRINQGEEKGKNKEENSIIRELKQILSFENKNELCFKLLKILSDKVNKEIHLLFESSNKQINNKINTNSNYYEKKSKSPSCKKDNKLLKIINKSNNTRNYFAAYLVNKGGKIYCYRKKSSKEIFNEITLYCVHRGCKAKIKVSINGKVKVINENHEDHSEYSPKIKDEKYPELKNFDWTYAQIAIKDGKEFIYKKY